MTVAKAGRGFGAARVYDVLRREILILELKPGQALDETSLSERFGVSRSPVREALVRLVSDGLVQTLPNKGTIVSLIHLEEFPQYIDALDLVQRAAVRLASGLRTEKNLVELRETQDIFSKTIEDNDILGMIEANRNFHVAIARASQNPYVEEMNSRLLDEGRRVLRLYCQSYDDVLQPMMNDAHEDIIKAITDRDADRGEALVREHCQGILDRFLKYMSRRELSGLSTDMMSAEA
ncbi:GntR family transcriptional regulator [Kiloniella sp. b19]|uniref:GntR family transcriptional regulator n=1 Tax=Kiloniella sp. GXU_MW_B19 TaxID=3141326 RepID=UPI0031DEB2AA